VAQTLRPKKVTSPSQRPGSATVFSMSTVCHRDDKNQRPARRFSSRYLERAKGFEPSTPTLARSCSTPELHPHPADPYHTGGGGLQALAPAALASLGRAAARCAAWHRRR